MASTRQTSAIKASIASLGKSEREFLDGGWFDGDSFDDEFDDEFESLTFNGWEELFEALESSFPESIRNRPGAASPGAASPGAEVSLDEVDPAGLFIGTWKSGRLKHDVHVAFGEDFLPYGCSCSAARGDRHCEHVHDFLRELIGWLRSDARLQETMREFGMLKGDVPTEAERLDPQSFAIRQLQEIVRRQRGVSSAENDESEWVLPVSPATVSRRICWTVDVNSDGYLEMEAMLQQRRKRGSGFTKGRKISTATLMKDRTLPLSKADEAVLSHVHVSREYYYGEATYEIDPLAALDELVGQDNVVFGRHPAQIKRLPVYLAIGGVEGGCAIALSNSTGTRLYNQAIGSDCYLLRIDSERSELLIDRTDEDQIELLRTLIQIPPVGEDRFEDLVESLAELQQKLSVVLPSTAVDKTVVEDARLAVLLRSNEDGSLDVGLRVRDAAGVLRRPLVHPMVCQVQRDDQQVQVIRCAEKEQERVDQLSKELGIAFDVASGVGTVREFATGLRLIEQLQDRQDDLEVLWDRNCKQPVKVLGNLSSKNVRVEISSKRNWFGVSGECRFGDQSIPLEDVVAGLSDEDSDVGGYVKLAGGQWMRISRELRQRLARLDHVTHKDRKKLRLDATAAPAVNELVDSDVELKASRAWDRCVKRFADAERLDPKLPAGLDADLRDYQLAGFKWLRKLAEWGVGGILADDMGLGKTLQTLAVLLDRRDEGPALVIAPTSVGFNWAREAERFAPDLKVHLYRETERASFLPSVGPGSLVVCSYGLALRDVEALAEVSWSTLVLDEAQAIKNSRSKTSKAIASINADWTLALTGTPVENHLGELWSLFHVVSPGVFGGWDQFRRRFAAPIEKEGNEAARRSLSDRLQPFVLRRTKKQVLTELPPRTEMNLMVDLSPKERAEYEKYRLAAIGELESVDGQADHQDHRFKVLAMMTRLRQISCHAGLVNPNWEGTSAKLDQLCETLASLKEEGHRALVFSQFTEYLGRIRDALEQHGFSYEYLDGSTAAKERQRAVDRFQSGDADAFLISLKAGGTGLNLTAADYVIHMDPWWNPAVEDQATDRAHRIGQDKPVMVYRIIARATIEEEILALHETKRDLVEGVMAGTQMAAKLSTEDLIRMLRG